MVHRLPPWVWCGAWVLSCIAGMINVVGLLGFEARPITHLTGTTSAIAVQVVHGSPSALGHVCLMLVFYMVGAVASGLIVGDSALRLGRRYGLVLMLESLLLFLAMPLLFGKRALGIYLACSACGLQNAMVTTFSGTVVRTTHVSGMFTDLGIFLGHRLTGKPYETKRVAVCVTVISGFFCGGVVAALLFPTWSYGLLAIPATVTGIAGLFYALYRLTHLREKP